MPPGPLKEQLERNGEWLFRFRGALPFLLVPALVLAMRGYRYPAHSRTLQDLWEALCLLVSLAGFAARAFVVGHAPRRTSGRNTRHGQIAETLNTTGAYSLVRHPLYLGNFLIGSGIVMVTRSTSMLILYGLGSWLYLERIMLAEEEFLRAKFGAAFTSWAAETPAFVPRWRGWKAPALPFCVRNVLKREYTGMLVISASFSCLDLLASYFAEGGSVSHVEAFVVCGAGVLVYLVLRALKRSTRLLHVDGR